MKSFKSWLYEKRKNPEQNPRVSSYEQVKPYLKDGYYISMRNINKLGINPESKYKTPNGIYSYHLGVYKDRIEQSESLKYLPYVSDAPYVYLFKSKIKPIKLGDMTEESVKKFIKEVFDKKSELKTFFLEKVDYLKSLERTIDILKKDRIEELKYGDDHTFNDKDVEFLKSEYTNTFKVEPKKYKHEEYIKLMDDTIKELEIELRELKSNINNPKFLIDKIYDQGKREALIKSPGGIFWWFSWFIYQRRMNKWNGFFREMGIYGVDDNKGESIIHPNEPFQTVFFDKTQLEVIKVFDNKDYIRYKKEKKSESSVYVGHKKFDYVVEDGIRVYRNIDISKMNLKKIPDFGKGKQYKVTNDFDCSFNQLTSLEGAPNNVGGGFYCYNNQLTSLEGAPNNVGDSFNCVNNDKKFTREEVREVCDVKGKIYV